MIFMYKNVLYCCTIQFLAIFVYFGNPGREKWQKIQLNFQTFTFQSFDLNYFSIKLKGTAKKQNHKQNFCEFLNEFFYIHFLRWTLSRVIWDIIRPTLTVSGFKLAVFFKYDNFE